MTWVWRSDSDVAAVNGGFVWRLARYSENKWWQCRCQRWCRPDGCPDAPMPPQGCLPRVLTSREPNWGRSRRRQATSGDEWEKWGDRGGGESSGAWGGWGWRETWRSPLKPPAASRIAEAPPTWKQDGRRSWYLWPWWRERTKIRAKQPVVSDASSPSLLLTIHVKTLYICIVCVSMYVCVFFSGCYEICKMLTMCVLCFCYCCNSLCGAVQPNGFIIAPTKHFPKLSSFLQRGEGMYKRFLFSVWCLSRS